MRKLLGILAVAALFVGGSYYIYKSNVALNQNETAVAINTTNSSNSCKCPTKPKVFVIGGLSSVDNDLADPTQNPPKKGSEIDNWFNATYVQTGILDSSGPLAPTYLGTYFSGDINQNNQRIQTIAQTIADYINATGNQVSIVGYSWGAEITPAVYQAIQKDLGTTKAANCVKHLVMLDPPIATGPVTQCIVEIGSVCYPNIFQSMLNAAPYIKSNPETVITSGTVLTAFNPSSGETLFPNAVQHYPFEPARNGNPVAIEALAKFKAGVDKALTGAGNMCSQTRDLCPNLTKMCIGGPYSYLMDAQGNTIYQDSSGNCYWQSQPISLSVRGCYGAFDTHYYRVPAGQYSSGTSQADANQKAIAAGTAALNAIVANECGKKYTIPPVSSTVGQVPTPPVFPQPPTPPICPQSAPITTPVTPPTTQPTQSTVTINLFHPSTYTPAPNKPAIGITVTLTDTTNTNVLPVTGTTNSNGTVTLTVANTTDSFKVTAFAPAGDTTEATYYGTPALFNVAGVAYTLNLSLPSVAPSTPVTTSAPTPTTAQIPTITQSANAVTLYSPGASYIDVIIGSSGHSLPTNNGTLIFTWTSSGITANPATTMTLPFGTYTALAEVNNSGQYSFSAQTATFTLGPTVSPSPSPSVSGAVKTSSI